MSAVNKSLRSSLKSMLVLIRNIEEMDTALEAANKYVILMQKLFDGNQQENWILGVWVRYSFNQEVLGRTDTTNPSMANSEMNY